VPRIAGYTASNNISVTLDNLSQIGPVVDAALDNGANQLDGVQFRLKNDGPVRDQALKLAKQMRRRALREGGRVEPERVAEAAEQHFWLPTPSLAFWEESKAQRPWRRGVA
jgi:uncharacterized protein YggE